MLATFNFISNMKQLNQNDLDTLHIALEIYRDKIDEEYDESIKYDGEDIAMNFHDYVNTDINDLMNLINNNKLFTYNTDTNLADELRNYKVGTVLESPLIGDCVFLKVTSRNTILVYEGGSLTEFCKDLDIKTDSELEEVLNDLEVTETDALQEFDEFGHWLSFDLYQQKSVQCMLFIKDEYRYGD